MPYKHNKNRRRCLGNNLSFRFPGIFAFVAFAVLNTHLEGYTSSMRFSV